MSAALCSGFGQFHTDEPGKAKRTPYASITWPQIVAQVDQPQQVDKGKAQWLIPSTLLSRTFKRQEAEGQFWVLWADLDKDPLELQRVVDVLALEIVGACDFEVYSSKGATVDRPKARILIPLRQPLSGAEWVQAQQVLNDELQQHGIQPDRASEGPAQLCYLPNRGAHYETASQRDGARFDPLRAWAGLIEAKRQAQADAAAALDAARTAAEARRKAAAARPGGTGGRSLIDAFNAAYTVQDMLLQAGYAQRGDTFRHPDSESGSYSASVKDGRVHSLSSADPLYTGGRGGGAHDAFSAWCVLEHGGDRDAALKDAGDNMLTIGGESWNTVTRREWLEQRPKVTLKDPRAAPAGQDQPLPVCDDDGVIDAPAPFSSVPVADLAHVQPPAPSYWWDTYLPAGVVTMLGAHGGTGKSTMALMLAVCIVFGLALFGIATRRGRVAFFSGEDGPELVRYRLRWVCEKLGVSVADLDGRLHILDATGGDPALFHEVSAKGTKQGLTTPTYAALREYIDANEIDVLIVDNASDTYDASEIDRARVRGFMRALARIAQARDGAVLLLAHVDKGTSRGDRTGTEGYSGSTAWHNSARSRLYLSRDRDGALLLEHQKHNLGKLAEPLRLLWPEGGIPQVDQPANGFVQHIADGTDTKALLKLTHDFYGRGEFIATDPRSRYHAAKVLGDEPTYPKRRKPGDIFKLLRGAERRELIEREAYRDRYRREAERWKLTPAGLALIGAAASAASAASTDVSAPTHTPHAAAASAASAALGGVGECVCAESGAALQPDAMADEAEA